MPWRLDATTDEFADRFQELLKAQWEGAEEVAATVSSIVADVRSRGDAALFEYTSRFDGWDVAADTLRFSEKELENAVAACPADALEALSLAASRIRAFHERQRPQGLDFIDDRGIRLGWRWTAIAAVGLYVPGGTAAYPSSVLMNAIPADVAGCERLVMAVPTPQGAYNPLVLAAARLAGVKEVYRMGGAQAVAALAFGTKSIAGVDKIVGPGNAYVAAAKRQVFGAVGIDMIAGPSEVLIVADGSNDPGWIAADLLAQAEHDSRARSILMTDSDAFATDVENAVLRQLLALPRRSVAEASWRDHGCVILVPRLDDAGPLIDALAPEHLQLAVPDPEVLLARVRNAGSIFLGRFTPEALGDYIAGPNHVLPTARSARFSSGLGVLDFMKRSTILGCDSDGLGQLGAAAIALAEAEGLAAHARSVQIRLNQTTETSPPRESDAFRHVGGGG